jgi:hypothetical protein
VSDKLVERLRDVNRGWAPDLALEAAFRIEALERALRDAQAALRFISTVQATVNGSMTNPEPWMRDEARDAIQKITAVLLTPSAAPERQ